MSKKESLRDYIPVLLAAASVLEVRAKALTSEALADLASSLDNMAELVRETSDAVREVVEEDDDERA